MKILKKVERKYEGFYVKNEPGLKKDLSKLVFKLISIEVNQSQLLTH